MRSGGALERGATAGVEVEVEAAVNMLEVVICEAVVVGGGGEETLGRFASGEDGADGGAWSVVMDGDGSVSARGGVEGEGMKLYRRRRGYNGRENRSMR